MEFDEIAKKRLKFLEDNYVPLIDYHLNNKCEIYLGDKINRTCRFCKKSEGEVTFKNKAHAIPEFTGNKILIAHYECDICNSEFSRLMESHMANYMNLFHTISQVKGKKGVPSFKTSQKKSRIDIETTHVNLEDHEGDTITTLDEENKTITIKAKRATYTPIAIYKCLTKMAITIMPEIELQKFKNTIDWLNEKYHEKSPFDLKSLFTLFSVTPGINPFPFTSCILFKRKDDHKNDVPYMLFLLAYGNFSFQIHLPLCIEDKKLSNKALELTYIPTPADGLVGSKIIARKRLDLNSKTQVKGEEETIIMSYESKEELI